MTNAGVRRMAHCARRRLTCKNDAAKAENRVTRLSWPSAKMLDLFQHGMAEFRGLFKHLYSRKRMKVLGYATMMPGVSSIRVPRAKPISTDPREWALVETRKATTEQFPDSPSRISYADIPDTATAKVRMTRPKKN